MPTAVVKPAGKSATILHSVKPAQNTSAKALKPGKVAPKATGMASNEPKTKKKANGSLLDTERRNYVEVAAYYIAQRRGFRGGSELEDWIQAEAEVDRLLK